MISSLVMFKDPIRILFQFTFNFIRLLLLQMVRSLPVQFLQFRFRIFRLPFLTCLRLVLIYRWPASIRHPLPFSVLLYGPIPPHLSLSLCVSPSHSLLCHVHGGHGCFIRLREAPGQVRSGRRCHPFIHLWLSPHLHFSLPGFFFRKVREEKEREREW